MQNQRSYKSNVLKFFGKTRTKHSTRKKQQPKGGGGETEAKSTKKKTDFRILFLVTLTSNLPDSRSWLGWDLVRISNNQSELPTLVLKASYDKRKVH